ncbi:replication-relaxation family protein [Leucobacter albus]|uniref:Replication-relaxation family protein n=1 Tax=Leucobacter albus TaxID=272210 RepID=A0ABW3TMN2_9MICO
MNEIINPMLDYSDEPMPWDKPVRSAAEEAELQAKKDVGLVSDGRKKHKNPTYKRKTFTDKDGVVLAFLAKMRVANTEQLSRLSYIDGTKRFVSIATMNRRLLGLAEAGMITRIVYRGYESLWAVTKAGVAQAQLMGFLIRDNEVDPSYKRDHNLSELPHTLAISQIAAILLSPMPFIKPLDCGSFDEIISEYEVRSAWSSVMNELDAEAKREDRAKSSFVAWREGMKRDVLERLQEGRTSWDEVLEEQPAFWTVALSQVGAEHRFAKAHHHPDLVVNFEHKRTGVAPRSYAIEIERKPKTTIGYEAMLELWSQEFAAKMPVYSKVVYFTNNQKAISRLKVADKKYGLIEKEKLLILPLTNFDKTPYDDSGTGVNLAAKR